MTTELALEIADDIDRSENDDQATEGSDDEENQDDEAVFMTASSLCVSLNSMTQQRLNHCMILHVHREETDKLNLIEVAKEFVEKNDRRKQFFGQFC